MKRKIILGMAMCLTMLSIGFVSCTEEEETQPVNNPPGQEASAPIITTAQVASVTGTTAMAGGNVLGDGASAITARGVCWSTSSSPTTADSKTTEAGTTGAFTSAITGLTPNKQYFVRAYATNANGTSYGLPVSFTTTNAPANLPVVTTTAVTGITQTTATGGGNVTSDGGQAITARGICWATTPEPTTANNKTTDAGTTGTFTSAITGLTAGTVYYVRAYATTATATVYGSQVTFTTTATPPVTGGPAPVAGDAICNGTQPTAVVTVTSSTGKIWMDRNLGASRAATSSKDHHAYGCLYQWGRGNDGHASIKWVLGEPDDWGTNAGTAVNGSTYTLSTSDTPPDALFIKDETSMPYDWRSPKNDNLWQGVNGINNPCPAGFRIPTKAEFQAEIAAYAINGPTAAYSSILKLPLAGRRAFDSGMVNSQGEEIWLWTSTVDGGNSINILIKAGSVYTNTANGRAGGKSVRCIKN